MNSTNSTSWANAVLLYLYSSRNIAGCVLALLGLGVHFGGVIVQWWLPICLGLYVAGALMLPGQTLLEVDSYRRDDGAHLADSVERLIEQTRHQLPAEALKTLQAIPAVLQVLAPRLNGSEGGIMLAPDQVQTVIGAVTRDLPQTVAGYVRLPPAFANFHPLANGKTAKDLLNEQLQLLKNQLDKIAQAAFCDDADALISNGQYLKEKFHAPVYLV